MSVLFGCCLTVFLVLLLVAKKIIKKLNLIIFFFTSKSISILEPAIDFVSDIVFRDKVI